MIRARTLATFGVLVALFTMLGVGAHATYGARVTADEPQYLLSAKSLVDDGDLDIADELAAEAYRPFHRVDLPRQTWPDERGQELSPHDPLLPALLALPYALGGWVGAKIALALLAGVLAALTCWVGVARIGLDPRLTMLTVGGLACAAPLGTYATQVYPEVPAALAVMVAVAVLTGRLDRRGQLVLAVAVTALVWSSVKYAPIGLTLLALGAWRLRARPRAAVPLVAAALASAVVHVVVHRRVYGGYTPYAVGDHFIAAGGELTVMGSSPNHVGRARRITGLLVDDAFGLAPWAPLWFLLPWALGVAWRRRPPHVAALVVPLAAGWFVATFVALTMHGWWWPGRQVVVVLPLAALVLAAALDAHRAMVRPAAVLLGVGVATWLWTTIEAITRTHVLVVDFDDTSNPWYRLVALALPDGRAGGPANDLGLLAWSVLLAASALVGAGLLAARRGAPAAPSSPDPANPGARS